MGRQPNGAAMSAQVFPKDFNNSLHHHSICLIRYPTWIIKVKSVGIVAVYSIGCTTMLIYIPTGLPRKQLV